MLLGSGGMEFYQISGKVMVSVYQRIILLSFSLKKKIQKKPHADFAVGSLPI